MIEEPASSLKRDVIESSDTDAVETDERYENIVSVRRSKRSTAGKHSNPHNLPRSAVKQTTVRKISCNNSAMSIDHYLNTMKEMSQMVTATMHKALVGLN